MITHIKLSKILSRIISLSSKVETDSDRLELVIASNIVIRKTSRFFKFPEELQDKIRNLESPLYWPKDGLYESHLAIVKSLRTLVITHIHKD